MKAEYENKDDYISYFNEPQLENMGEKASNAEDIRNIKEWTKKILRKGPGII
jgi:hypothetical protein